MSIFGWLRIRADDRKARGMRAWLRYRLHTHRYRRAGDYPYMGFAIWECRCGERIWLDCEDCERPRAS